jgi:hypothetical protein
MLNQCLENTCEGLLHACISSANFKLDQSQCSLFMTVRLIFEISEDDHPRLVTHARDIWWTLDFANAFVSPGVNSRGELVPSHGASRRRLWDNLKTVFSFTRFPCGCSKCQKCCHWGPPGPHIFLTNHIRNGTGCKIGASEAIQKRLEWENPIFFAA